VGEFKVTARIGPKVRKERYETLGQALAFVERGIAEVGGAPARSVLGRDYEPVRQVAGRFELRGPGGVRCGVDVRGDGSAEAYRGRIRKQLVERADGETAIDALRRELGGL
jgi:hypothetical protein